MAGVTVQLSGAEFANRDANISLANQITGQVLERKPFLDGSLTVQGIDPGLWELKVTHPNLQTPIDQRVIRIFPQVTPTLVPVTISPALFQDVLPVLVPPVADLTPVQQMATSARDQLRPVGSKTAGEAIRAEDWNALVSAVSDLASATLQLAALVSPVGHAHPEINTAIGKVQDNLRTFAQSFGDSLVELRREIESEALRRTVDGVVALGQANETTRTRISDQVAMLTQSLQSDTTVFTQNLATTGSVLLNEINNMAVAQGASGNAFLANASVQNLTSMARQYVAAGTQTSGEAELQTYRRTSAVIGGAKLSTILGN